MTDTPMTNKLPEEACFEPQRSGYAEDIPAMEQPDYMALHGEIEALSTDSEYSLEWQGGFYHRHKYTILSALKLAADSQAADPIQKLRGSYRSDMQESEKIELR